MFELNLPFAILTVILVLSTITDVKEHRIPNILSLGGVLIGIIVLTSTQGFAGLFSSLQGMALGLVLFLPFYLLRGMAAGDVKLMAAVGAFIGPSLTLAAAAATLIVGAVLAIAYAVYIGGAGLLLKRYSDMAKNMVATHQFTYFKPCENDAGSQRFPYAAAILVGTYVGTWWFNQSFPLLSS